MKGKEESFPFYFVLLHPEYKKDENNGLTPRPDDAFQRHQYEIT